MCSGPCIFLEDVPDIGFPAGSNLKSPVTGEKMKKFRCAVVNRHDPAEVKVVSAVWSRDDAIGFLQQV